MYYKSIVENNFNRFLFPSLAILLACLALLSLQIEKGMDVIWLNGIHNYFFDRFFYLITTLGNGLLIIPFVIIGLIYRFRLAIVTGVSFSILGGICSVLKQVIAHPRPTAFLNEPNLHYVQGVVVHAHNSFPSGHTATAFCFSVLTALCLRSKAVTIILLIIAFLVGLSRIYLLQHFLMDVAAGAFLGSVIGLITWHLIQKMEAPWLDEGLGLLLLKKGDHDGENAQFHSFSK